MSLIVGPAVVDWVASRTNEYGNFGTDAGIGWLRDGELVAGVAYAEWNGVNLVCHIASDGSKRWLTREFLRAIFDFPFNQQGAQRLTVCVGEGNSDSRRFVLHLGFSLETTLEAAHPTGSLMIFRLWKKDCRWIRADYFKRFAKAA